MDHFEGDSRNLLRVKGIFRVKFPKFHVAQHTGCPRSNAQFFCKQIYCWHNKPTTDWLIQVQKAIYIKYNTNNKPITDVINTDTCKALHIRFNVLAILFYALFNWQVNDWHTFWQNSTSMMAMFSSLLVFDSFMASYFVPEPIWNKMNPSHPTVIVPE